MSDEKIVPLGTEPPDVPEPPVSRPGLLHGIATIGMAVSIAIGLFSAFLYITVTWSGTPRRAVIGVLLFSILAFFATASAAVLTAARDTYARTPRARD